LPPYFSYLADLGVVEKGVMRVSRVLEEPFPSRPGLGVLSLFRLWVFLN